MKTLYYEPKEGTLHTSDGKEIGWWFCGGGRNNSHNYVQAYFNGKVVRYHRLVWSLFYGNIPKEKEIDHIDGDTLNNKIENLRAVTRQQNRWNSATKRGKTSKGVFNHGKQRFLTKPWCAHMRIKGKTVFSKYFETEKEAAAYYQENAIKYLGEYARK